MNKKSLFFGMAAFAIAALVFVSCDNGTDSSSSNWWDAEFKNVGADVLKGQTLYVRGYLGDAADPTTDNSVRVKFEAGKYTLERKVSGAWKPQSSGIYGWNLVKLEVTLYQDRQLTPYDAAWVTGETVRLTNALGTDTAAVADLATFVQELDLAKLNAGATADGLIKGKTSYQKKLESYFRQAAHAKQALAYQTNQSLATITDAYVTAFLAAESGAGEGYATLTAYINAYIDQPSAEYQYATNYNFAVNAAKTAATYLY